MATSGLTILQVSLRRLIRFRSSFQQQVGFHRVWCDVYDHEALLPGLLNVQILFRVGFFSFCSNIWFSGSQW